MGKFHDSDHETTQHKKQIVSSRQFVAQFADNGSQFAHTVSRPHLSIHHYLVRMSTSRPASQRSTLQRSGNAAVVGHSSDSLASTQKRVAKLQDIKKKQELRDMLITKLCLKFCKGVRVECALYAPT